MAQNIVYSPAVPFVGSIPGVLAPGFTINIKGTTHPNCSRIGVNLQCGPNIYPRDDVVLHLGVDFTRACVIRNSIHNNNWGPEETQQNHFPFIRGVPFLITLACEPTHFRIAINNQHFASFEHRIVYHRASHLTVDGDVILENIEYISNGPYVAPQSGLYPPVPGIIPPMPPGYASAAPYPTTPGMPLPYPTTPSPYGQAAPVGTFPGGNMYGGPQPLYPPHSPNHSTHGNQHGSKGVVGGLLNKIGAGGVAATAATAATAGLGYLGGKKAWKMQKKSRKKALKYGIPLAGAGLGAYALSKAWSSSSSSSSSDEE